MIPFLLRSRHGDERALAERIKSCALRELAITTVSSYGNRPAVFKISERLRNILKYVVAAVITSVTIFVVISSTLDLSRVETEQCMLPRELL